MLAAASLGQYGVMYSMLDEAELVNSPARIHADPEQRNSAGQHGPKLHIVATIAPGVDQHKGSGSPPYDLAASFWAFLAFWKTKQVRYLLKLNLLKLVAAVPGW